MQVNHLFEALQSLQLGITNESLSPDDEIIISEVSLSFSVNKTKLKRYLYLFKLKKLEDKKYQNNCKGHRPWSDVEKLFIIDYMNDTKHFKTKSISFKEIALLLGRSSSSTQFVYYNYLKSEEDCLRIEQNVKEHLVQLNTEEKIEMKETKSSPPLEDGLSYIQNIAFNYQKMNKGNLETLLKEISTLSSLACLGNQFEEEKEQLLSKLDEKSAKINELEKDLSFVLQEYNKLKNIVLKFRSLDSLEKLGNLRDYDDELNEAVNQFNSSMTGIKGSA